MRCHVKLFIVLFLGFTLTAAPAFALTVLKNDEAKNYLGDTKTHLLSGHYTYAILVRSHRDSMHGRFSDGLIFSPEGGNILYLRNKDGDRKFAMPAPEGREKEPVTEDAWRQKIKNTLSDDNPIPYVFLDNSKRELAVIFVGRGTEVVSRLDEKNRLEVSLVVEGARDSSHNRRMRR